MHSDLVGEEQAGAEKGAFPPERVQWSVGEGFVLFAVFLLIHPLFAPLGLLLGGWDGGWALQVVVSNAAVLTVVYFFLRRRIGGSREAADAIGLRVCSLLPALRRAMAPLAAGLAALLAWAVLQSQLVSRLELEFSEQEAVRLIRERAGADALLEVGLLVFLGVAVVPLAEELVFRGLLYLPLRRRLGGIAAALAVSAVFAAIHLHPAGLGHLFILALMFTWLMEATGTIIAPILAHGAHNACMIAVILAGSGGT